ncbi:MAG: SAV_6107 family HEPN domain-containing protein [Nocardioides sp.]
MTRESERESERESRAVGDGRDRGASRVSPALLAATERHLTRSTQSLHEAMTSVDVLTKYACAQVAALRAALAVLSARPLSPVTRSVGSGRCGGWSRSAPPAAHNAWTLLAHVAPELAAWAEFFAGGPARRATGPAGSPHAVTDRAADELIREVDRFLAVIENNLGLVPHLASRTKANELRLLEFAQSG